MNEFEQSNSSECRNKVFIIYYKSWVLIKSHKTFIYINHFIESNKLELLEKTT